MKKLNLLVIAAVTLAGAATTIVAAENGGPERHHRHHRMMQRLEEVGVTDAQKEQIRSIMRESRPTMRPLVKQMIQERRALRDAIHATPVNEAAIRAQAARVAQVQADLAVRRAHVSDKVRAVLTPEQAAKLKEMSAKHDAKVDSFMNRGGGHDA